MALKRQTSSMAGFVVILALLGAMIGPVQVQAAAQEGANPGKRSALDKKTVENFTVGAASDVSQLENNFPTVVATSPQHGDVIINNPEILSVQFSTNMLANGSALAVNKTTNYLLVEDGADGKFQTTSCTGQLGGDDTYIAISKVTYEPTNFTSTLTVPDWPLLNQASYQLLVCASTRITDTAGNRLSDGSDPVIRFILRKDV